MSKEVKKHLVSEDEFGYLYPACGELTTRVRGWTKDNTDEVTCKNCKRTNEYKRLESQQKIKQETDKEMEDIKNEVLNDCEIKEWDKSKKYDIGDKVLISSVLHEVVKNIDNDNNLCLNCVNYINTSGCCMACFKSIGEGNYFKQVEQTQPTTYKAKIEIETPNGWDFVRLGQSKQDDYYVNKTGNVVKHISGGAFPYELKIIVKKKVKTGAELIGCLCYVWNGTGDYEPTEKPTLEIVDYVKNDDYRYKSIVGSSWRYAIPVSPEKLTELKENLEK